MPCAKRFTALVLIKGYQQMELAEKYKEITLFSTPEGFFRGKFANKDEKLCTVLEKLISLIVGV